MADTADATPPDQTVTVAMTAHIVSAYVTKNPVSAEALPSLIGSVHEALVGLSGSPASEDVQKPAVPIRQSVKPDYIVCLEDGRRMKMLKRHLATAYGMTPDQYRAKWNLPPDYPIVAPNYSKRRSDLARQNGLGK